MQEEFVLDFDPSLTTQDRFNIEVHVNMRVNGREMFKNTDHSNYTYDPEVLSAQVDTKNPMTICPDGITTNIKNGYLQLVKKPTSIEINEPTTTIPVYPQEFASWFIQLLPQLRQPKPTTQNKYDRELFIWRMTHEMVSIGCGIVWPDITIYERNDLVFIQERPFAYKFNGRLTLCAYTECITMVISRNCFLDGVKAFVKKLKNNMSFIEDRGLIL